MNTARSLVIAAAFAVFLPFGAQAQDRSSTVTPEQIAAIGDPLIDARPFMAPSTPEAVRNAALRMVWMSDPSIRDYINPARVYADTQETAVMAATVIAAR